MMLAGRSVTSSSLAIAFSLVSLLSQIIWFTTASS